MSVGQKAWAAIRHDVGRKLLALLLALGTWGLLEARVLDDGGGLLDVKVVTSLDEAAADRNRAEVPAIYLIVPPTLIDRDVRPQKVNLQVKGLRDDVQALNMWAYLEFDERDLGGDGASWVDVSRTLGREDFRNRGEPPELTLFRLNRESTVDIHLKLARRVTRAMPLGPANVVLAGEPARGFQSDKNRATVLPGQVNVSGPSAAMEDLAAGRLLLQLAPVSIDGRSASVQQNVALSDAAQRELLSLGTPDGTVLATVPIVPIDIELDLVLIPVVYLNEDALKTRRFGLVDRPPATVDVKVRGPQSELGRYVNDKEELAAKILPVLDWSRASLTDGPNRHALDCARIDLSQDVQVLDIDRSGPPKVQFTLEALVEGP